MNERAKADYERAVGFRDMAAQCFDGGDVNKAIILNGLGSLSIELAKFAAENHALVAGIDEDMIHTGAMPNPVKPQGVWGGAP